MVGLVREVVVPLAVKNPSVWYRRVLSQNAMSLMNIALTLIVMDAMPSLSMHWVSRFVSTQIRAMVKVKENEKDVAFEKGQFIRQ